MIETKQAGTTFVTASFGPFSATYDIEAIAADVASLTVTATEGSAEDDLPVGAARDLRVMANFTDGSSEEVTAAVGFSISGAGSVVQSLAQAGRIIGENLGPVKILVSYGNGSLEISLLVVNAVPTDLVIDPAARYSFTRRWRSEPCR